jgi:hypothetical protein
MISAKPYWRSRTLWWAAILLACALVPIAFDGIKGDIGAIDLGSAIAGIWSFIKTACSRINAVKGLYTPDSWDGPNKKDFEPPSRWYPNQK